MLKNIRTDETGVNSFIYTVPSEKNSLKILQLADTQMIDLEQARVELRFLQLRNVFFGNESEEYDAGRDLRTYDYIRELVKNTSPDVIMIVGDVIYGETDDSGRVFKEFISLMDSFKLPWGMCFGNHDNESGKGVSWQTEQLEKSKYCMFAAGKVTGNSNYNILFERDGVPELNIFVLDTNGCT